MHSTQSRRVRQANYHEGDPRVQRWRTRCRQWRTLMVPLQQFIAAADQVLEEHEDCTEEDCLLCDRLHHFRAAVALYAELLECGRPSLDEREQAAEERLLARLARALEHG